MTRLSSPPRTQPALQNQDWSGRFAANDQLVVAIEAMPLKDFVHYSFAEALKANYVMAQGLPGLDDPVTMNLEKAVSSRAYYKLVTELLVARGIGTTFRDGVYYLAPLDGKVKGNIPIGFGRRPGRRAGNRRQDHAGRAAALRPEPEHREDHRAARGRAGVAGHHAERDLRHRRARRDPACARRGQPARPACVARARSGHHQPEFRPREGREPPSSSRCSATRASRLR